MEDFRDSEEDRRSETYSDLSEPEVGVIVALSSVDRKGEGGGGLLCNALSCSYSQSKSLHKVRPRPAVFFL